MDNSPNHSHAPAQTVPATGKENQLSLSEKLVQLVKQIRPEWNDKVVWACLKEAHEQSHPPPEIIHAMMHAATSPECRTPRGFFMPQHWPSDSKQAHATPPDCPEHIGKLAHNCGECRAVTLAVPDDHQPQPLPNGAPRPANWDQLVKGKQ